MGTHLRNRKCVGVPLCVNSRNGICTECEDGFIAVGRKCIDNTGNCATLGNNGLCLNCKSGFILQGYICIKENTVSENCYISDRKGNCSLCFKEETALRHFNQLAREVVDTFNRPVRPSSTHADVGR